jgi:cysteine desulfurase
MMHGGAHEFNKRAGTENISGIVGFGKACEIAKRDMEKDTVKMEKLRDKLIDGLLKSVPRSYLNGDIEKRLPHNAHIRFDFIEGEALLIHLDMEGIAVSTGSACSTKSLKPSHVLLSIGLKHVQAHGSLRFTLSKYTQEEDIDYVLNKLPPIVQSLRSMSPLTERNINGPFPYEEHEHGEDEHS